MLSNIYNINSMNVKLKGLEFLNEKNVKDFKLKKAIVENKPEEVFNTNEFQYNTETWDYVSYKNINNAIDLIVDMVGLTGAKFDTGDQVANEYIETLMGENLGVTLEKFLKQAKDYGNAYLQVTVEENIHTSDDDKKLCTYLINPDIVYADFDNYNPNRPAKSYSVVYEKDLEKDKVTLVITFKAGAIEYRAFISKNDRQYYVNPLDYFPELFPEDFDGQVEGEAYIVDTPFKYNLLQGIHYKRGIDEFYGTGDLDSSVISKINSINRLANLAMEVVIDNSQPKFEVSASTARVMRNAIDESTKSSFEGTLTTGLDLKATPNSNNRFKRTINFLEQQVANLFGKKSMILEAQAGESNKYINNPYNIQQSLDLQEKFIDALYKDLYISPILYKEDMTTGELSGVALERMMILTSNHVKNFRDIITPVIQRTIYTILEVAQEAGLATFGEFNIPTITWHDQKDYRELIEKSRFLLEISPSLSAKQDILQEVFEYDEERAYELAQGEKSILVEDMADTGTSRVRDRIAQSLSLNNESTNTQLGA